MEPIMLNPLGPGDDMVNGETNNQNDEKNKNTRVGKGNRYLREIIGMKGKSSQILLVRLSRRTRVNPAK